MPQLVRQIAAFIYFTFPSAEREADRIQRETGHRPQELAQVWGKSRLSHNAGSRALSEAAFDSSRHSEDSAIVIEGVKVDSLEFHDKVMEHWLQQRATDHNLTDENNRKIPNILALLDDPDLLPEPPPTVSVAAGLRKSRTPVVFDEPVPWGLFKDGDSLRIMDMGALPPVTIETVEIDSIDRIEVEGDPHDGWVSGFAPRGPFSRAFDGPVYLSWSEDSPFSGGDIWALKTWLVRSFFKKVPAPSKKLGLSRLASKIEPGTGESLSTSTPGETEKSQPTATGTGS